MDLFGHATDWLGYLLMPVAKRKRAMFSENIRKTPLDLYGVGRAKGRFGIELELEGPGERFPPQEICPGWRVHQDGSVRGLEYVLSQPHDRVGVRDRMVALNEAMKKTGFVFEPSHRASTHIHMNVSREPYINILGLIILFTMIEPVFLRMCGPERDGNLFCLPSYDTGEIHLFFERLLEHITNFNNHFPMRGKYSSMNTNPVTQLGSVEFRVFPSTIDTNQIETWCIWLENMMEIIHHERDQTFRDLYLALKSDPSIILRRIFGVSVDRIPNIHELVQIGCMQGHELRRLLSMYMKGELKEREREED